MSSARRTVTSTMLSTAASNVFGNPPSLLKGDLMITSETAFYIAGGPLQRNAPSYVERQADRDLYDALNRGEQCVRQSSVATERRSHDHHRNTLLHRRRPAPARRAFLRRAPGRPRP